MPDILTGTVRILLVDDHGLFRESLARLLAAEPDFQVAGLCATTEEALLLLAKQSIDLMLLDFDLGNQDCPKFIRSAIDGGFKGKILLVTAGVSANQAAELIHLGVVGIFLKHDLPVQLTRAIREVAQGQVWLNQKILTATMAGSRPPGITPTERERQVLSRVLDGLSNKEIAAQLGVSEGSVKSTLQQLFSKTGVRSRSQLVRIALERYKDLNL